jgi:ST7 protein
VPKKSSKPKTVAKPSELIAALLSQLEASRTSDAVDQAQEIMFDAWDCDDAKRRLALARKALKVSADCADAYLLLAQEAAPTPQAELDLLEKAVAAGERALGQGAFVEDVGYFWGLVETRPYMRARLALACALWDQARGDQAADHAADLLRLNPNDNQGVRYALVNWLLTLGREAEAEALLRRFKDPGDPQMAFPAALLAFRRKGDTAAARKALARGHAANAHIAPYLTGRRKPPKAMPDYYSPGDRSEAVIYVAGGGLEAWAATPGAVAWLAARAV